MFDIPEILEKVFEKLDSKDLLKIRSVATLWNDEAIKQFLKRGYEKEIKIKDNEETELVSIKESIERLEKLLPNSKHPEILFKTLELELSLLTSISTPEFQRVTTNYGHLIRNLKLSTYRPFDLHKLPPLLSLFQNIETFRLTMAPDECTPLSSLIQIPFPLKNLSCLGVFDLNDPSTTSLVSFMSIFKNIIKSTDELKALEIKSQRIAEFLKLISEDLELKEKLQSVKGLKLNYYFNRSADQNIANEEEILKGLPLISENLETLAIFTRTTFPVSRLPLMPSLSTLIIDDAKTSPSGFQDFSKFNNAPKLNTIMLGDIDEETYTWPLKNTKWSSNLVFQGVFNRNTSYPVPLSGKRSIQDDWLSRPLNICITLCLFDSSWLAEVISELSKLNLKSMFLYFMLPSTQESRRNIAETFFRKIQSLSCCVLRSNDENVPNLYWVEVLDRRPV